MPRFGVSQCSALGLFTAALVAGAVGAAGAHPAGPDDSVAQSSTCGQDRQLLHRDSPARYAVGQIDAVLIESASRAPVPGGKVVLTGHDMCGDSIHRHLATGATGQVSFRGLQPGHYQVTAYRSATTAQPVTTTDVELSTPTLKTVRFTVGDEAT
ncbi:carboxypeptidase-like regulatory domain-containing protein [Nocardia halotolerans]|uniref:Carboxypeptidase-like regulatory domain-containing protein n=1 Tax=Nocardia halotolerans TaxID=1755878 RepID=A0ABV8VI97_9NOCA